MFRQKKSPTPRPRFEVGKFDEERSLASVNLRVFGWVVGGFPGGEPQRSEQKVHGTDCKKVYGKVLMGKYLENTCPL